MRDGKPACTAVLGEKFESFFRFVISVIFSLTPFSVLRVHFWLGGGFGAKKKYQIFPQTNAEVSFECHWCSFGGESRPLAFCFSLFLSGDRLVDFSWNCLDCSPKGVVDWSKAEGVRRVRMYPCRV